MGAAFSSYMGGPSVLGFIAHGHLAQGISPSDHSSCGASMPDRDCRSCLYQSAGFANVMVRDLQSEQPFCDLQPGVSPHIRAL